MNPLSLRPFSMYKVTLWRKRKITAASAVLVAVVLIIGLATPAHAAVAHVNTASGNNGGGSNSLTINNPSTAPGQLLILVVTVRDTSSMTSTSGWTNTPTSGSGVITASGIIQTHHYKFTTASEPASYTFTLASSAKASGVIAAYSGVDTTSPFNVGAGSSNTSSTTMTAPSITTTIANTMLVATYGSATGTTFTQGSGMTLRGQNASTSNGAASRTTTGLQDVLQSAIGSTGAKTMTAGNAATNAGYLLALNPSTVISQAGYRFFTNQDSADVGAALSPQNNYPAPVAPDQPVRLRMLLGVDSSSNSLVSGKSFKLQYQETGSACTATGTYTDITDTTPIQYYTNATVIHNTALTANANDPARSGVSVVNQTYIEANNFTNTSAIPAGQDGMWDFALTLSSSASRLSGYCIRAVYANGSSLTSYAQIPRLSLAYSGGMLEGQGYRLYENANSATPGSPLASSNAAATLGATGDQFRLRATANGVRGFMQVSSGGSHSCGVSSDNKAYCWGTDSNGQMGNGDITGYQPTPGAVDTSGVLSGKTVIKVVTGNNHACALSSEGLAYCWGRGVEGQLGSVGFISSSAVPVAVDMGGSLAGKTFIDITSGVHHTCAISSDYKAYCWGYDFDGELGNSSGIVGNVDYPYAVDTSGALAGKTILSIAAGAYHTCAIASDNQAYCWGSDSNGQIGNGATTGDQGSPVAVVTSGVLSGKTITSLSSGGNHTCSIASDNLAYCWGVDVNGELGNGATTGDQVNPVAVDTSGVLSGKTVMSISAAYAHTCVVSSDYQTYCWGIDSVGQLGNDTSLTSQASPAVVNIGGTLFGKTILSISAGTTHTCVIASDNLPYCWGNDGSGQLGNGATTGDQVSPVAVDTSGALSGKTILSISAGDYHTCAIASDNLAYCWGDDGIGQLGNGATTGDQASPVAVDTSGVLSGKTIFSVSLGAAHTCAIASDNLAYCWGDDSIGTLGNGATTGDQASPVAVDTSGVLSGKTVVSLSAGDYHTCAIASDNLAYCWGDDSSGRLGDGPATGGNQTSPVAVDTSGKLSGKTVLNISASAFTACVIASDNQVYCWGNDAYDQLGNGPTAGSQPSPVAVSRYIIERLSVNTSRLSLILQYAQKSAATCAAQTGFATITAATPIALHDNASVTSKTAVTPDANDPTGGVNVAQTYHDIVDVITNTTAISGDDRGLWDISLKDNGAPANTTYCLRFANSEGDAFSSYAYLPEVTTAASSSSAPTLEQSTRGGQGVIDGIKHAFSW